MSEGYQLCEICGHPVSLTHTAQEMMFGMGDSFDYSECLDCGRLKLLTPPLDWSRYYPPNYYSFTPQYGLSAGLKPYLLGLSRMGLRSLIHAVYPLFTVNLIHMLSLTPEMSILDVGGGNGQQAKELREAGFSHALCIDPFASRESEYCLRASLADVDGRWDRIMFHSSFEHIEDQLGTLVHIKSKLAPGGICLIRIPVLSWAWKNYGTNWVQLDCPRHACIHTPKSIELAAKRTGLKISKTIYDSSAFQFWGSELYCTGVSLAEGHRNLRAHFTKKQMRDFEDRAQQLNESCLGDQAAFFLVNPSVPG